jgi:hypothetical protein
MASARIKVTIKDTVETELVDSFEGIVGMFGKTYRVSPRQFVILPNSDPKGLAVLKAQLDAWVKDGALSWSDAT